MVPIFAQASGGEATQGEMQLMPATEEHTLTVKGDGAWCAVSYNDALRQNPLMYIHIALTE